MKSHTLFWSDCFKLKNSPVEEQFPNISLGQGLSKKTKIIIFESWTFDKIPFFDFPSIAT